MKAPFLSDIDFSRWEIILLFLLPAFLNLLIYCYVTFRFRRNKLNTFFMLFILTMAVWQVAEGMVKMSFSLEGAQAWHKVSETAILFVIAFGVLFFSHFTEPDLMKGGLPSTLFLYLPLVIFLICTQTGATQYSYSSSQTWYWIANPIPNFITGAVFTWSSLGGLYMVAVLLIYFVKNKKNSTKRKQARLLLYGLSIPVFGGIVAEVIFPFILKLNDIPLTATLGTILSYFSVISITKHRMLEYSPRHQWESIVENMTEGILIVNTDEEIMYANKSFCRNTGYDFDEIKGKVARELLVEKNDFHILDNAFDQHKKNKYHQFELPIKTRKGEMVWLRVSSAPYCDQSGKIIGSIGIQTNITEQKNSEEMLRYSESRLKQAQTVAKIGSWELNFGTGKGIWSDEACRIYGIPTEERFSQSFDTWLSYVHPDDLEVVKEAVEKQQASLCNSSLKHRILLKDGNVKHIRSVAHFEFNAAGFPIGMFGVCHDITEQVEAGYALEESEKNIRTFINESLMGIYFVDPESMKIQYSNPALSNLLGYSSQELKNMSPDAFFNHSKENADAKVKGVMDNKRINNGEREWKTKDGKIVNVLISSFYHQRNGINTIYVAAQDITERKIAEKKLEATNKELELFIYKASHDIRGPLASVMGLVNVSKLEVTDQKSAKYLDMINTATQKLDYTLGELVKAMKMRDVTVFNEEIDFDQLTDEILKRFFHFPGFLRLKISKEIISSCTFHSNRSVLETILQNLIENAIKYQKTSGVESFVNIKFHIMEKKLQLTVEDNGIGIEELLQPQIFDMYFKANENSKGSGLGLYLVKKGIEKLDGEIELTSRLGVGTTFKVTIPNKTAQVNAQKNPS
jgi:PAS domain S-box-containing protein